MSATFKDLTSLAAHLNGLAGAGKPVVLDGPLVGSETAAALKEAFALPAGQSLTVSGFTTSRGTSQSGDVLTVTGGTAAVLRAQAVPVTLAFWFEGAALQMSVTATMPDTWTLTTAFPDLTLFPFDVLGVSHAVFAYTTVDRPGFHWPGEPGTKVDLAAGQNLLCRIGTTAVSLVGELLGKTAGETTLLAHGPFAPVKGQVLPVGELSASILGSSGFSVGTAPHNLTLTVPRLAVRIGAADYLHPAQDRALLIKGTFHKLEITVSLSPGGDVYHVSVAPLKPGDGSVTSLIEALPGGSGITSHLPSELTTAFSSIGLDEFSMAVRTTPPKVLHAGLSVSTLTGWKLIPGVLELERLRLVVETLDPSGVNVKWVRVLAQAEVLPKLLPGPFMFTVDVDKPEPESGWEITSVSGTHPGAVSVGDLLRHLTGSHDTVPQELRDLVLSDFGITATRKGKQPFSYTLHGTVDAALPLHGTKVPATLNLTAERGASGDYSVQLDGGLVIGDEVFRFDLAMGTSGAHLKATWKMTESPLEFTDIADAFGWTDMPALPSELDLALVKAGFRYDFTTGALVLTATSQHYGDLVFATSKPGSDRRYLLDLVVPLKIALSDIPVAGPQIPAGLDAGIQQLAVVHASAALDQDAINSVNTALSELDGTPLAHTTVAAGTVLTAALRFGGDVHPLSLPLSGGTGSATRPGLGTAPTLATAVEGHGTAPSTEGTPTPTATPPAPASAWITVGKSLGPLHLERVGVQYHDGVLLFLLDADIALGPLALSLDGLGVGSELKEFRPEFALSGLGVSYDAPPIEILGAMLRVPDAQRDPGVRFQYDGELLVRTSKFTIGVLGSYAQLADGLPSLFLFAELKAPLGGPAAFFVTGLMGGFGVNRRLTIPGQDEVDAFPLLALTNPPGQTGGRTSHTPSEVLDILEGRSAAPSGVKKQWIKPEAGEYWLAAGLEFTSYKVVTTRAMLAVEFGNELTIALLGLSVFQLPLPLPQSGVATHPYAYVEMMIRLVLEPSRGSFEATAILSKNSYVLTPDCHLTGGFAFYLWFGDNPHSGEFVTTLGGYHPAFKVPAHFPRVPRLGFNWAVSDEVSIKGEAYAALTSSCVMAGGALEALFHDGGLRAWFTAHADFLVSWHPFFFTGEIGVSIGVSVRLGLLGTITLSLGADVSLWGPPTGGVVRVHLVIVSFSVHFGADRSALDTGALDWKRFTELLPHGSLLAIAVTDGLFKTRDDITSISGKKWIVRAKQFAFDTRSAIPASVLTYDGKEVHRSATAPGGISVKPMDRTGIASTHALTLHREGSTTPVDIKGWQLTPLKQTVPASLWGTPPVPFTQVPGTPSADAMKDAVCGFSVTAPAPAQGTSRGSIAVAELREEYLKPGGRAPWSRTSEAAWRYVPTNSRDALVHLEDMEQGYAKEDRTALHALLTGSTFEDGSPVFTGPSDDLPLLASQARRLLTDVPLLQNG
ncbi:DUF6603 domain-containing protein [Streptomyces sp. NPDC048290]|uniref:DUF6603 domain-containing protein n=1 Tax=Streptomyces sp. NPDC048290 TaxID=3155811 RepID=UPI003418E5ED